MQIKSFFTKAALLASAVADYASFVDGGRSISVNIPENTARSGSGPIYFQISAPSGTTWLAFGQGSTMDNANIFVVYSAGSTPVISPRQTSGHNMPQYDSSIKVTMLDGSGVRTDGSMVINARCDNCLSWDGGSMSPTSSTSNWIMAYKSGNAVGSSDKDAQISRHDRHTNFQLDLTAGIGGSSSNPFVASASASGSATASGASRTSLTASATGGISSPVASSNPDSSSSSSSGSAQVDNTMTLRSAHGIIMSILFLGAFPLFALTLYLPTANKVRFIHAPLQILSVILLIVALALGIVVGMRIDSLDTYHQIIGFIVVFILVLVQPVMGVLQHLHFHKTGGRSMWGPIHQNLGRGIIALGIVNGGLGWQLAGNTGAYIPYAIVSVVIFLIYAGVVAFSMFQKKGRHSIPIDKESNSPNGYEMQNKHRRLASENVESTVVHPK